MVSRRVFVKASTLTALSAPLYSSMLLESQSKPQLRLGVIGCGDRGSGISSAIQAHPLFSVEGVCDVIPFRLEALAQSTNSKPYDDYRALLDNKNIDAVIIAVPFGLHYEVALDAIAAEKHIYCEKTMVKGIKQIQSVLDAQRNSDLIFQTGHQYNSSELYQKVEQMIKSGYLGEVTAFECQWNRNGDWRRDVPDPKWERLINWRMYKEHSGGLVAELCSHQIDFINRVLGELPKKIMGNGGIDHWQDGRETFDNVHLLFEYPNGIDASFTSTTTNAFEGYQIKILGSKATVVMGMTSAKIYLEDKGQNVYGLVDGVSGATKAQRSKGEGAPITARNTDITVQALEQFHASIFDGADVYADIASGANTSKCVQMCLDAMYEEKIVRWDDYPGLSF
ncbi:MAG: Gfo/Idh/MocA family oxidoreductase [Cyclobacteriaceae bacterium]